MSGYVVNILLSHSQRLVVVSRLM